MTDETLAEEEANLSARKILGAVLATLGMGLLACMALGAMGNRYWIFDLLNHFYLQYAVLGLLGLVVSLLLKRFVAALSFGVAAVIAFVQLLPLMLPSKVPTAEGASRPVRVATLNVLTSNLNRTGVSDWLLASDSDVLVTHETNDTWIAHLDEALITHTRLPTPTIREDNFGMAVYLRTGIEAEDVTVLGSPVDIPWIELRIIKDGTPFDVVAIHTRPPIGGHGAMMRDMQFRALAQRCNARPKDAPPLVVMGDLNATIWSKPLQGLVESTGLRCACYGAGVLGTWPTSLGFTGMILIDHVLVSPSVSVVEHKVGKNLGSDHRGIIVDLLL